MLCGIMKMLGGNYDYCTPIIDKLKDLISKVKSGAMDPIGALKEIRTKLGEIFNKFKSLAPVAAVLNGLGELGSKSKELFAGPIPSEIPSEIPIVPLTDIVVGGKYTVDQIKESLKGSSAGVAFGNMLSDKDWDKDYKPNKDDLTFLNEFLV
jgi:hypothetical protein